MKKFVLVLVSTVFLMIFGAINYLLWDRDNKIKSFEFINDSKNVSIDSLRQEVGDIQKENEDLKLKAAQQSKTNEDEQVVSERLRIDKESLNKRLERSNGTLKGLQSISDLKLLEDTIKKWVDSIDKGHYEAAFNLQTGNKANSLGSDSVEGFVDNYCKGIKSMAVKSIKPYSDKVPDQKEGCIFFKVELDVKRNGQVKEGFFKAGVVENIFGVSYDTEKSRWFISDVFGAP